MKGMIWNCRSIKKSGVASFLKNLILEHKFLFIGLQETMQVDKDDTIIRQIDVKQCYLWKWLPSKGKSGGLLCGVHTSKFDEGAFVEGNKLMLQLNLWDKTLKKIEFH